MKTDSFLQPGLMSLATAVLAATSGETAMAVELVLHEPVVVSQAPAGVKEWGPWQFPLLQRLADGQLLAEFQTGADSATDYGLPMGQAVSDDNGASWHAVPAPGLTAGLRLPNGDELRAIQQPSVPLKGLAMPKPWAVIPGSYDAVVQTYYWRAELPANLPRGWAFLRRRAGGTEWVKELAQVTVPDQVEYATEGVYVVPFLDQDRIQVAPDGRLLSMLYVRPQMSRHRTVDRRYLSMLLESADQGRTWTCKSTIPYCPDPKADPDWDARDGFTEPQIGWLPDGSLLALMRTSDGNSRGPLYATRSPDSGASWEKPRVFNGQTGSWPQILSLKNGVTVVSSGAPGVYLCWSADPAGKTWSAPLAVVPHGGTCGYSDLLALNDHEFLIVYSNFDIPDRNGQPRKTILCRKVTVRKTS